MNGVLIAIVLALLLILGVGFTVSRMGAAPKPPKTSERDWFV